MDHPEPSTHARLASERYGGVEVPRALAANDVVAVMLNHRSVRAYLADRLSEGTLETLVAAAQSAPTSSNMQAWSVVAVQDEERRARLAELSARQDFIRKAPLFLCWIADLSRLQRVGEAIGTRFEGLDYLESFMVALADAAFAAQNAVVAAASLGLGTVYVGSLRNRPDDVAAVLELPPNAVAVFGLCVGYADPAVPTAIKPRLPQSVVLHRETYDVGAEPAGIRHYDGALDGFTARTGQARTTWTVRMLNRVGRAGNLGGRDRMSEVLRALGLGLR
ncbi:NADPH-dependent oxidoreductase [Roseomonas sp. CCTCC AB2023176]|uniref:NADPH-dependent oxidoreductase n=1 Tax=Roseomonas sp. CCTCC AB2023176 TaxID=3342640 RepID=UPI0035E021A0